MKRLVAVLLVMMFLLGTVGMAAAGDGPGPAPNSGDGIPDDSGMDSPNGPCGDDAGVPDGSGF